ncbi:hypothetical protein EJ08DRAFT_576743, partial [Tothia fuscella]
CNNEHEPYEGNSDKDQMTNLYQSDDARTFSYGPGNRNVTLQILQARLDALLFVIKDCRGPICVKPWSSLHQQGNVISLTDALGGK